MLKISRGDIRSDILQEYPVDTRFIKLPVDKYLKLLGIELNPAQIAMVNSINSPNYRFLTAAVSRRVGKTTISNIIGQLVALVPGSNVLIMSPNYNLSSISFDEQRKLIKNFDLEVTKDNYKDKVIELSNSSTIRMGSVSQVDSSVGRSYDCIIFDEAALTNDGDSAFEVALRPTLDKPNSKAIFISTPRGKQNWFAKYFNKGFSTDRSFGRWVSIHADWTVNPRASPDDIEEAKRTMSRAKFAQEYEASFTSFEGQIFKFDSSKNSGDFGLTDNMDVIMGVDIGYKDPTCAIVFGYNYDDESFYALDEYYDSEKTTDIYAAGIKLLEEQYNVQAIYIDSAAAQTRADFAYNHDLSTIAANKSVLDGIAYLQMLVEQGRLFVDNKCKHLLETLDQYRWDDAALMKERPVHDEYSHAADAFRYACYSFKGSIGEL